MLKDLQYKYNMSVRSPSPNLYGNLLLKDIKECGSMHENYHADTGDPLAPSADHVDENGKFVGFISWNLCVQNMLEGVVEDNWMLLEIGQ